MDVASASNFRCFQLQHLHLDLRLNFAVKEMSGWLVLDLVPVQPGVQTLVLDSHSSLLIHSIDCKVPSGGQEEPVSLTYRVDPFTDYGSSLNISLPTAAVKPGRSVQITVRYTTTDGPAVSSPACNDCELPIDALMVCDVCADLVVGLGADLRSVPSSGLHSGSLGLQPLLLPLLRHAGREEHVHRHGQGESRPRTRPRRPGPETSRAASSAAGSGRRDGSDERVSELVLQAGPGLSVLHGVPRPVLPGGVGGRRPAARRRRSTVSRRSLLYAVTMVTAGVTVPADFQESRVGGAVSVVVCGEEARGQRGGLAGSGRGAVRTLWGR